MIDRISIVSRLTQTLYAGGVPADRVKYIPHHMALFDAIAQSWATGTAPSIPLALMAGDLCPFEVTGESELDLPIPFTVVEPPPEPAPETSPKGAAAVEPVKTVAPTTRGNRPGTDWDQVEDFWTATLATLAQRHGVSTSAVYKARQVRRRAVAEIPSATPKPKPPEVTVSPERQAELDAIEAAMREGKGKRFTREEVKADLDAKYKATPRYGRGRPPATSEQAVTP